MFMFMVSMPSDECFPVGMDKVIRYIDIDIDIDRKDKGARKVYIT